ncbi:MAG TPA: hypothetical protein VE978_27425 [Chitinophagales bacterium]|nr:hypothetical protein [Chitinophagales bacterium]
MKSLCIVIIIILSFNIAAAQSSSRQFIYWENLSAEQQSVILNSKKFPSSFITFYNSPEEVGTLDDNEVLSILDSIVSNINPVLQPFYYNLFRKMCEVADGYIGEVMGECSINLLFADPEYIINHVRKNGLANKDSAEFNCIVRYISFEYQSELNQDFKDRPSWPRFTSQLKTKMVNASEENKKALDELLNRIKHDAEELIKDDEEDHN